MSLRINIKQGEILELTDIYSKDIIKYECQKSTPNKCDNCAFINNIDICGIMNCLGNYREDNTFVKFVKIE